jgi:glucose-1-phosphate cytidylyltransferase
MTAVILAGGRGRRLGLADRDVPKPLVEVAKHPLMWHVVDMLKMQGVGRFVIATGHRADLVEEAFRDWDPGVPVELVFTGIEASNGDRLRQVEDRIDETRFLLAWCDGLSDFSLADFDRFHASHGKLATILGVNPPIPFGALAIEGDRIVKFKEKAPLPSVWVSGGFFILERKVFQYLSPGGMSWEHDVLPRLAADGELMVHRHHGYWKCMDTMKDRDEIEADFQMGRGIWSGKGSS